MHMYMYFTGQVLGYGGVAHGMCRGVADECL